MEGYEPHIERLIREAIERGELAVGGGAGEPISGLEQSYDPEWWARSWLERDRAARASAELAREIVHGVAAALRSPAEAGRRILDDLNERIEDHNRGAEDSDRLPLLDVDRVMSRRGRAPRS